MTKASGQPVSMTKKIVLLDWCYEPLLQRITKEWRKIENQTVIDVSKSLNVGAHHAMVDVLKVLGWQAKFLLINSFESHNEWIRENRKSISFATLVEMRLALSLAKLFSRDAVHPRFWPFIGRAIAKVESPDVLYIHDSRIYRRKDLDQIRASGTVPVLQQNAFAPTPELMRGFSAMVSCLRWLTNYAADLGLKSLHLRLSVDFERLPERSGKPRDIDVSFIGSVTAVHPITIPLLRAVAMKVPRLAIYGPPSQEIKEDPLLSHCYVGEAWGKDMFDVFLRSKVTLNRHGDVLGDEVGNYRLYEATACGAALVTDRLNHLEELFDIGSEVVAYETPEEAADLVDKLLEDDEFCQALAQAGEARTRRDHHTEVRMRELSEFLHGLISR